jgi:hypothetical protein
MLNEQVKEELESMRDGLKDQLKSIKQQTEKDLEIDDIDLDRAVLDTPKLLNKYNIMFTDATLDLKDLYGFKEKVKLERFKYWAGRQTDQYYAKHGLVHEKILKGDIDKYLSADDKLSLVNEIVSTQKAICDFLERTIKEIQSRNFHCKIALEHRKFMMGGS